jgi:hypothetical protein
VTVGKPVTFAVAASGTAPLSYQWQRNGSNIAGATSASYTIPAVSAGDNDARFRCRVTNSFGSATSNEAVLTVTPNTSPTATISAPAAGSLYSGGETIAYSGTGTDAEDGVLPASAFTWEVVFHHDSHTHPYLPPTGGSKSGSFVVPSAGETSVNVWYRIHLTVRDTGGLTHSVYRDVRPRTVTLSFGTIPPGLALTLEGQPIATPASDSSVVGLVRSLGAPSPQSAAGKTYQFVSWSDGGAASHNISTPSTNTAYTATFAEQPSLPAPWVSQDVGPVGIAGSATFSSGAFALTGSGADIGGASDQFHYVYQTLSGDGQIVARVTSVQNTNALAKAGIMIRESLDPASPHAAIMIRPGGRLFSQYRDTPGGGTNSIGGWTETFPHWMKLVRTGNAITAYRSKYGSTWATIGTVSLPPATDLLVGLAVTSHDNSNTCTTGIDSVTVTSSAAKP